MELDELTFDNFKEVYGIERDDISEDFVDGPETFLEILEYGAEHDCIGHTFIIRDNGRAVGTILLGEALDWPTDPPEVKKQPFYRLMLFVLDKNFRGSGIGSKALDETVKRVYEDFGVRPIVMGCHKDNVDAARFYERHGFRNVPGYMEGNDLYYVRYPMEYRRATTDDVDQLAELRKKQLIDEGALPDKDIDTELRSFFEDGLGNDELVVWVASEGDVIVSTAGVCFFRYPPTFRNPSGIVAYVTNVYTRDEYRGHGIATALMDRVMEEIRLRGCKLVRLHASSQGRRLYEKLGFADAEGFMIKVL